MAALSAAVALGLAGLTSGAEVSAQECHPAYVECVPWVDYDLNCDDLGYPVNLYDPNDDPYGLDGWNYVDDGFGCEMYAF
jgi:hypothetical protein